MFQIEWHHFLLLSPFEQQLQCHQSMQMCHSCFYLRIKWKNRSKKKSVTSKLQHDLLNRLNIKFLYVLLIGLELKMKSKKKKKKLYFLFYFLYVCESLGPCVSQCWFWFDCSPCAFLVLSLVKTKWNFKYANLLLMMIMIIMATIIMRLLQEYYNNRKVSSK